MAQKNQGTCTRLLCCTAADRHPSPKFCATTYNRCCIDRMHGEAAWNPTAFCLPASEIDLQSRQRSAELGKKFTGSPALSKWNSAQCLKDHWTREAEDLKQNKVQIRLVCAEQEEKVGKWKKCQQQSFSTQISEGSIACLILEKELVTITVTK